jgi:hypothetical protein
MRDARFSESQIVGILREAEGGVPVAYLLRETRHQLSHLLQVAEQVRRGRPSRT